MNEREVNEFLYKGADDLWAYDLWEKHENLHWLPREVPMKDDVYDWNSRLSEGDRMFLKGVMSFFTQADIEVHNTYIHEYLPYANTLGVSQMLTGFAARECIHVMGYAYGLEELVKGAEQDIVFRKWMVDDNLLKLHEALNKYKGSEDTEHRFKHMVATTLFGEGVMLFAQFAMLLNYARNGYMRGLGQIVSWSIRDEDYHVYGVTQLMKRDAMFRVHPQSTRLSWYNDVHDEVWPLILTFAKDCFDEYSKGTCLTEQLTFKDVQQFLEFQAQRRMRQAGISTEETTKNNLLWFDAMVAGVEHANFFEQRATEYSKGNLTGDYEY